MVVFLRALREDVAAASGAFGGAPAQGLEENRSRALALQLVPSYGVLVLWLLLVP